MKNDFHNMFKTLVHYRSCKDMTLSIFYYAKIPCS